MQDEAEIAEEGVNVALIEGRIREYKAAAIAAKKEGDKGRAVALLKFAKAMEPELEKERLGIGAGEVERCEWQYVLKSRGFCTDMKKIPVPVAKLKLKSEIEAQENQVMAQNAEEATADGVKIGTCY